MSKNIGISDVAKYAGVSVATVSRALNDSDKVTEDTKRIVQEAICELGYKPNALARSLRMNESKTIGVIVSNVVNPFFMSVVRGIENKANQYGYSLFLCNSDEKIEKEEQHINNLASKQVDGLIIATTGENTKALDYFTDKPIVFVDRKPSSSNSEIIYDTVLVKNTEGGRIATEYLLSKGHKRIGFINGSAESFTGRERLEGYIEALRKSDLGFNPDYVRTGDFLGSTAYRSAEELICEEKCDAIFAGNNLILNEIMKVAKERGVRIPEELELATFDDIDWLNYCDAKIASIKQPVYEIGTIAIQMLYERLTGYVGEHREILLDVDLIER